MKKHGYSICIRPNVIHKPQEDVLFFWEWPKIIFVSRIVNTRKAKLLPLYALHLGFLGLAGPHVFTGGLIFWPTPANFFYKRRSKAPPKKRTCCCFNLIKPQKNPQPSIQELLNTLGFSKEKHYHLHNSLQSLPHLAQFSEGFPSGFNSSQKKIASWKCVNCVGFKKIRVVSVGFSQSIRGSDIISSNLLRLVALTDPSAQQQLGGEGWGFKLLYLACWDSDCWVVMWTNANRPYSIQYCLLSNSSNDHMRYRKSNHPSNPV